MILRLLNGQGVAGIAVGLALAILLGVQTVETRHWKKQSASFEQLYHEQQAALATTAANARAAAETAHAADLANVARVAADQRVINERTSDEFESRLAAARAAAARINPGRVRAQPQAAADPGSGRSASMPGVSAATGGAAQATGQDRLSQPDALTATEQAIQLDELIKWVRAQAQVPANAKPDG
jgi:hypothetical protein